MQSRVRAFQLLVLVALAALFLAGCGRQEPAEPAVPPPKPGPIAQVPEPEPVVEEEQGPPELPPLFADIERR